MFASIGKSFGLMIGKPKVFVPAIIALIVNFIALYFLEEFVYSLLFGITDYSLVPNVSMTALPFYLYAMFFKEINITILLAFIVLAINIWLIFVFTDLVKNLNQKKDSIGASIGFSLRHLGKIIGLSIFFTALIVFLGLIGWIIIAITMPLELIGAIIFLLYCIFLIFLTVLLVFLPTVQAATETKMRSAFRETRKFALKHFWGILILLILVSIIAIILNFIAMVLGIIPDNDLIQLIVSAIFGLIILAFSGLVFPLYYFRKTS